MSEDVIESGELSSKQLLLISKLVSGMSIDAASKSIGIASKTVSRWLKQDHVQKALKAAQQELFDASMRKLQALQTETLSALEKHVRAAIEPSAGTHLRAAIYLHSQAVQNVQIQELQAQIAELKSMITLLKERDNK